MQGILTGQGTNTLGVVGTPITFVSSLSDPYIYIDYVTGDTGSAPYTENLLPGTHVIEGPGGADAVDFTVSAGGQVGYAASLQGIFTGQGTDTLGVVGVPITFDSSLSSPYLVLDYEIDEPSPGSFVANLLPGSQVIAGPNGTGEVDFTVGTDGTVGYAPSLQGILTGQGTNTLDLVGTRVTIDATALYPGASIVFVDYEIEASTASPFGVILLPGDHLVAVAGVGVVSFTVNDDGTISYDPSEDGELSGQGTTTLIIKSIT